MFMLYRVAFGGGGGSAFMLAEIRLQYYNSTKLPVEGFFFL